MKALLDRLHARLGDFWWYSLMIFMAARAADCLNVFVGLWLVPKYVPPSELGAVHPLAQFASFLTVPAAVFASTFRQELTGLAIKRDFGKMKTLMRGVFIATAVFFFVAIIVSRLLLPHFLERIRIAEGSLGLVILAASFIGATAPVYTNALQALKKFKAFSAINVLCAPVRLVTMLIMMPFRALTGYFVGQAATPAFSIAASVVALRTELSVPAEPYWNRAIVKRLTRLFLILGVSSLVSYAVTLIEATVIRQRLPELDSAAYYLVTRFSEISTFLATTLMITLFPFAADLSAQGRDNRPLILKCMLATVLFGGILALFFALFGAQVLTILPNGERYSPFSWAIPAMIAISVVNQCGSFYITAETAAARFAFLRWTIPLHLGYIALILFVTGCGYFTPYLSADTAQFLANHNIRSLETMVLWLLGFQVLRLLGCLMSMAFAGKPPAKRSTN